MSEDCPIKGTLITLSRTFRGVIELKGNPLGPKSPVDANVQSYSPGFWRWWWSPVDKRFNTFIPNPSFLLAHSKVTFIFGGNGMTPWKKGWNTSGDGEVFRGWGKVTQVEKRTYSWHLFIVSVCAPLLAQVHLNWSSAERILLRRTVELLGCHVASAAAAAAPRIPKWIPFCHSSSHHPKNRSRQTTFFHFPPRGGRVKYCYEVSSLLSFGRKRTLNLLLVVNVSRIEHKSRTTGKSRKSPEC